MENSARLYHCARCRCQVIICRFCDRGQIYCTGVCAKIAENECAPQESVTGKLDWVSSSRRCGSNAIDNACVNNKK